MEQIGRRAVLDRGACVRDAARRWIAGLVCGAACGLFADVAVGTGETLVFTNASDLAASDACVTLADGATFRAAEGDATRPGFVIRRREDDKVSVSSLRYPRDITGIAVTRDATNLRFDVEVVSDANTGVWTSWGRWRAPETGTYSFFSAMDDAANVLIDGVPVLNPTAVCAFTVASNVFLDAGWHTVQIHVENYTAGRLGPLGGYSLGLGWTLGEPPLTPEACGKANRFLDAGDGADVQQVHSGMFCRRLDVPAGTATLDMTGSGLVGPFAVGGSAAGLRTGDGAQLLVKGCTNLVFNGQASSGNIHFPLLDADVAFADDPAGTVRVYGQVSLARMRPNYEIDPSAEIAYWGHEMLTGTEWTLTNAAAHLLATDVLAPTTTVVVAEGCKLTLKPCRHSPANTWLWEGVAGVFTNDFTLAAGAKLQVRAYKDLELAGALRGNGRVVQIDNVSAGPFVISGDVSQFSGTLQVQGKGGLVVRAAAAGDGTETVVLGGDGTETNALAYVALQPAAVEGVVVATGRVNRVDGRQPTAYLNVGEAQELRVRRFEGIGGVKTANLVDSHATIEELAAGACLVLRYTANVTVASADAEDATVRAVGVPMMPSRLELAEGAGMLPVLDIAAGAVVELAGTASVARVTGAGTLVVSGDATLPEVAAGVTVRTVAGGVVRTSDGAALAAALGARPALWLDAAKVATCEQYLNCVFTNGIVVRRWNDCRPDQTALYGLNPRGEGYVRVYPYVKTNALNGLNVVSMGALEGKVPREYGHVNVKDGTPIAGDDAVQPETRRMPFNQPILFRTAIAVVNSAFGGGPAILGGFKDGTWKDLTADEKANFAEAKTACLLARGGGGTTADYQNPATPIFGKYRRTWVDGEAVDPTVTGYGGGWQIVSFESATEAGEEVRSLAMQEGAKPSGGIDYAEVLVYTNALTAAERRAVERYLAHKWGVSARAAQTPVNGTGTVVVEGDLRAAGAFAGTVELKDGARLDLASVPPPPGEEAVPAEGRAAWFDPDAAADLVLGSTQDGAEGDLVYALFDRGRPHETGTFYLHGTYNPKAAGAGDRRPRAVRGARGDGPERTWLVFREDPEAFDGGGNTLRLKTDVSLISNTTASAFYSNTTCPTRTAFIVSDSCYGGGTPVMDKVNGEGLVRRRRDVGDDFTKPIWADKTSGSITGGVTRLNGAALDGTKIGFSGAPEVFSFTTTNDFPAAFVGSYLNGNNSEGGTEVLGEILLYDRVLEGDARDGIERYLMYKWLGVATGGACDWRRATVTGAGTVTAAAARLPAFDAAFAGTLALADAALAFHVDAAGTVTDALALPAGATLALPEAGALTVSFAGRPASCTLATAGAITGIDPAQWTATITSTFHGTSRLVCTADALRLEVVPSGTVLLLR